MVESSVLCLNMGIESGGWASSGLAQTVATVKRDGGVSFACVLQTLGSLDSVRQIQ